MPDYQNTAVSGINILELLRSYGLDRVLESQGPARDALLGLLGQMGLSPEQRSVLEDYQAAPRRVGDAYSYGLTGPQAVIQEGLVGPGTDWVRNLLNYFGETPQNRAGFGRGMEIAGGRTPSQTEAFDALREQLGIRGRNAQLSILGDRATQFLANNGMTPSLDDLMGSGLGMVAVGGRTPQIDQLSQLFGGAFGQARDEGRGLISAGLQTGGFNPQLQALLDQAMGGLRAGGANPALDELTNQALSLIRAGGQGGALIPMEQAQSMARDQAITASRGAQEAAVRRALSLGGGPGSRTSGGQVRALGEFADQSAQAEAAAIREATQTQQALQLQQLLGAFGAGNQAQATTAGRLGTFAGLGGATADAAARNLSALLQGGVGLQGQAGELARALLGLEGVAGENVGRGFQGAGTAGQLANARIGTGANLGLGIESQVGTNLNNIFQSLQGLTQGQTQGLTAAGQFSAQQVQGLQDLMDLFQGLTTTGAGMATSAGAQGVQRGADVNNLLATLLGGRGRVAQEGQTNLDAAIRGLSQQGANWMQFAGQTIDPYTRLLQQLMQAQAQPGFWSQLAQGALQGAIGGFMGGVPFGNIWGGGGGGGGQYGPAGPPPPGGFGYG